MSTRRELLRIGSLAGVAALVPWPSFAEGRASETRASETRARRRARPPADTGDFLRRSYFEEQIEGSFTVRRPGARPVRLRLVEVADPAGASLPGNADCFSAFFRGPARTPIAQGTYEVRNYAIGRFELFIVPVGRPGRTQLYEAAFNRVPLD